MTDFGGSEVPASEGAAYGRSELEGSNEPELLLPVGSETTSWILKAESGNNSTIYVGWDEDVDVDTGFPLGPKESLSVDLNNVNQPVWGVSNDSGDAVRFIAVD